MYACVGMIVCINSTDDRSWPLYSDGPTGLHYLLVGCVMTGKLHDLPASFMACRQVDRLHGLYRLKLKGYMAYWQVLLLHGFMAGC